MAAEFVKQLEQLIKDIEERGKFINSEDDLYDYGCYDTKLKCEIAYRSIKAGLVNMMPKVKAFELYMNQYLSTVMFLDLIDQIMEQKKEKRVKKKERRLNKKKGIKNDEIQS
jgi:hypothetical protein